MMMRRVITMVTAGLLFVGCGSNGNGTASPAATDVGVSAITASTAEQTTVTPTTQAVTTTVAPTTTTEPPPTPAEVYLELVTPNNCAMQLSDLVWAQEIGGDTFTERQWPIVQQKVLPTYTAVADASVKWMEAMVAYDGWPADLQADIDALVAETSLWANWYATAGQLSSIDAWNTFMANPAPPFGAATVVRAKLGLPSNVNDATNWCEGVFG